jgi:stage III sporulation protein AB
MWLKILGVILIIAGSGLYGLGGARKLDNRVRQIKLARLALSSLEQEIMFLRTPLSKALLKCVQHIPEPVHGLFVDCSNRIRDRQGITVGDAWAVSVNAAAGNHDLACEELETLSSLFFNMGWSGAEDQQKLFALAQSQLSTIEEKARLALTSGRQIRVYGGFIAGTALVLLLI